MTSGKDIIIHKKMEMGKRMRYGRRTRNETMANSVEDDVQLDPRVPQHNIGCMTYDEYYRSGLKLKLGYNAVSNYDPLVLEMIFIMAELNMREEMMLEKDEETLKNTTEEMVEIKIVENCEDYGEEIKEMVDKAVEEMVETADSLDLEEKTLDKIATEIVAKTFPETAENTESSLDQEEEGVENVFDQVRKNKEAFLQEDALDKTLKCRGGFDLFHPILSSSLTTSSTASDIHVTRTRKFGFGSKLCACIAVTVLFVAIGLKPLLEFIICI